jgi:acetyl esterase/lipase
MKDQRDEKAVDSVTVIDEQWSEDSNGIPLQVRLYIPSGSNRSSIAAGTRPAILDLHGGMWCTQDRTLDQVCNRALAEAGFVVAAIDFSQGPVHQHPAASRDVVQALQWFRKHAARFHIDPDRIGLLGTSSGGHLAMYSGLTPNAVHHHRPATEFDDLIKPPKFIVALWPVSCPLSRYRYAKRAKITRLVEASECFFETEDRMREASIPRLVTAGEFESLPPLLVVHPGEDGNVPVEITYDLMRAWHSQDGYLEYSCFPGQPHAFGLKDSPETQRLIALMISFVQRFG